MKDSASAQAAGLVRNKKAKKKGALLVLCLSLLVGTGTLAGLHLTGIAMTHESKVLECHFTGEAAHTHNDDCYDVEGMLVCPLEERALHTHDDSCYTENSYLACGMEESAGHVHTDACYTSRSELTCGLEEGEDHRHTEDCWTTYYDLSCGIPEGDGAHSHTDDCYVTEQVLTCELPELTEEHIHGEECFVTVELTPEEVEALNNTPIPTSEPMITPEPAATEAPAQEDMFEEDLKVGDTQGGDPWADVEDAAYWDAMFRVFELKGDWDVDLLAVAQSQLGYCESTRNYIVNEAGKYKGYTRYGAWYGSPYGDWCAMFVSFCIRYAGIPAEAMPIEAYCPGWVDILTKAEMFGPKAEYSPEPGDLIFFTRNGETAAHVGLVFEVFEAEDQDHEMKWWVKTIEGNSGNTVRYCTYELGDERILGYGILPEEPPVEDEESPAGAETEEVLTDASGELTASEEPQAVDILQYPEQHFDVWADAVHVRVDAPEGAFPADVTMEASPIYDASVLEAAAAAVESEEVFYVKAVEIAFTDTEGGEIEPSMPVNVTLSADAVGEAPATRVVDLTDVTSASVIESESQDVDVFFDADTISCYALVGTTVIEKNVLASDGHNYSITVTFGPETGIPADADLAVEELLGASELYEAYVAKTENALGMEEGTAAYIRLFDISIVDKDDHSVKYQPAEGTTVDVKIELADSESDKLNVVHFADENSEGDVVDAETDGQVVSFEADGFSVYSVVSRESATGSTALDGKTYVLVTNNNALLMGEPHASVAGRLAARSANPTVGGTLQVTGTVTMWTFEAVPGRPDWYYISDGNGNYLNITSESGDGGTVTLGEKQAIYVASETSGGNTSYQLRNGESLNGSKAVNNYNRTVNNGFGAWKSSNASNDWFRLYDMEYLGDVRVSFNANGGSAAAPADQWGLAGDTITLPDYSGTRNGYEFLGWFTRNGVTMSDDPRYFYSSYPPGSTYTIPDSNTTLYAVWNNTTPSSGQFYIRLDGKIPNEPGSFDSSDYTGAITITGAIEQHTWIIDSDATKPNNGVYIENTITEKLNQLPSVNQLVANLNNSANKLGFKVVNQEGEIVVSEITNAATNSREYNVEVGECLYVLWYVQKPTSAAWHVDGVLLKKDRVNVAYDGNTPDGSSRNVPLGYQVDPGTDVTIGANGSPNGTVKTPTRTGYIFIGWNTKPDGSGDSYSNQDTYTVHEDVTFYAQWSKGTNLMTVSKTNDDNEMLAGAQFRLEEITASGQSIEKANRTTNESGIFTYDQMENDTLYRMTETYAPNGYEIQNSFYFKVDVDEHNASRLQLYVCDASGNHIAVPDWLTISYIGADDPGGNGVARIQFNIRDERILRRITFIKVDEEGNPLSGAEYTLTGAKGQVSGVLKSESDSDGVFSVDDAVLPYGSYTLTETNAPTTFAAHEPVTFTLNDYLSGSNHGLTITSDESESVVEASCDVSSVAEHGLVTTTYAYTIKVQDVKQAHIFVTKDIAVDGDLSMSDLNTTIYYALTKKGEEQNGYVTKENGDIWIETMEIVNGVPTPDRVVFDGVDFGEYDVWEMALINGEYTRMYSGLVVSDSFQLDSVSASSADGGNNANLSENDLEAQVDFTNRYGEITQSTSFIAQKKWTDRAGNEIAPPEHAVIEFTLYSEKKDERGQIILGTLEEVRSIELDGVHDPDGEDVPWTATFKYLPMFYEGNLEYRYKVMETVTVDDFYPNNYPQEYYLESSGGSITNRRLLTDVELHKHFEIYPEDPALLESVQGLVFTLTGPDGEEVSFTLDDFTASGEDPGDYVLTLHDLPLGEYSLAESGQETLFSSAGYDLVYSVSSVNGESPVGDTEQPVLKLELQNSYAKSGTLVVRKNSVIHEAVDEETVPAAISEKEFSFVVRRGSLYLQENGTLGTEPYQFLLRESEFREFSNVPAGQYTVIEQNAAVEGYLWEVVDGTRNADGTYSKSLTIDDANSAGAASFDNLYTKIENGSLTVSKNVVDGPEEADTKDYKVEITTTRHGDVMWLDEEGNLTEQETVLTVSQDQPLVFASVPAGTYIVTEDEEDAAFEDYSLAVTYAAGEEAHSAESPLTIHKDGQGSVTVTNTYTYLYTPVRITKTVTGNMGDKTLYFGFDVYVRDADDQPIVVEGVTDEEGMIQFSLKDEEEKLIEKLPKGAKLTIVEHNVHYTTTVDGRIGVDESLTENRLDATETHDDLAMDTTESYTFIIPDEGATVDFTNDHTVEHSVVLKKIGFDNQDNSTWDLAGATFKIYEDEAKTKPVELDGRTEFTSGEDGVFYSGILGVGTYYLEETVVPDGYYEHMGMFVLTIAEDGVSLRSTGTIGQPTLNDWITAEPVSEAGEQDPDAEQEAPEAEETVYTVSIRNTIGVELPYTGGRGTLLYTLCGALLCFAAGGALCGQILRRRRNCA